jgi:phosphate transport system substrate-binding protein
VTGLSKAVLSAVIGAMLAACGRTPTPTPTAAPPVRFRIVADGATLPLLRALADAYSADRPNVIITLESGNPNAVADRVMTGQAQLGATSLLPASPADAKTRPWLADLAYDGIAVIVHTQNPITDLSLPDVRAIFSGERNHWRDYGAEDIGPIDVAVREGGDGTRVLFDQTVMGAQRLTLDALVMPSIETMINFVAIKPGGIGYAPTASVFRQNTIVKAVMISGKAPTPETILSGEYPLVRTLNLMAPREPQGPVRDFVIWLLGAEGKQIAQSLGYVTAT